MKKKGTKPARQKNLTGKDDYTKVHSLKKAADGHARNIRKRGGTAKVSKTKNGFKIQYHF